MDSVSKRYNLCGARIGCIASHNKDVMAAALKFGQSRLCPPVLGQYAAIGALDTPQEYFDEVKAEYIARRDCAIEMLNAMPGVFAPTPLGAFYTIAELPVDDDTNVRNVFDNEVHQQSVYIQLKGKYILASITSGLMIIDQHRAHVRVLFDQYMSKMEGTSLSSQTVLFPEVLHLTNSQNVVLNEIMPDLELMGFTLASLGGNDWSINSIPAGFDTLSHVTDTLIQVIDSVENGGESIKTKVHEHIALNVARSAALPYGRTLNQEEMDKLVADLLRLPEPNYTPDGKNVINTITFEQISKLF